MREGVGNCFGLHEGAPDGAAQVRRIKAAENAVPVSVIALAAEQKPEGLIASLLERPGAVLVVSERGKLFRDAQHFFVHQVRFGIFGEKAAPKSTAQKGRDVGASGEFIEQAMVSGSRSGGQSPLHHFLVGSGGQIGAAERRMRVDGVSGSGNVEPVVAILERGEEIFEPAVLVAMRVSAGPAAEFFEIVAHGGDAARMRAGLLPEEMGAFGDVAKRDEIAKRFESREKLDGVAQILGGVVAVELFGLESGGEEMVVVDERVFDAARGERGRKLRLPDALGEPGAARTLAEMFFDVIGEAFQLLKAIVRRNRDKDGLVKTAAEHFHLTLAA